MVNFPYFSTCNLFKLSLTSDISNSTSNNTRLPFSWKNSFLTLYMFKTDNLIIHSTIHEHNVNMWPKCQVWPINSIWQFHSSSTDYESNILSLHLVGLVTKHRVIIIKKYSFGNFILFFKEMNKLILLWEK